MLATEVRAGDAPKPLFSMKIDEKSKKSGNQPLNRQKKNSLFPSLNTLGRLSQASLGASRLRRLEARFQSKCRSSNMCRIT